MIHVVLCADTDSHVALLFFLLAKHPTFIFCRFYGPLAWHRSPDAHSLKREAGQMQRRNRLSANPFVRYIGVLVVLLDK